MSETGVMIAENICVANKNVFGQRNAFLDLVREIMDMKNLQLPKTPEEGIVLYKELIREIKQIS